MVNEEKIKIMTKLASYEENEGKKDLEIIKRTKADYISYNSFVTCLFASIAVFVLFAADFGSKFLDNLARFTDYDFVGEGVGYLTIWILIMAVYSFLSGRMYRKEYDVAEVRLKHYQKELRDLEKYTKSK
jgi:hypothetical protein